MGVLQKISNWFVLVLMVVAADLLSITSAPIIAPRFVLIATVPLLVEILASRTRPSPGLRLLAMAVNWVAAVLMTSLAAAALTGIGGTSGLAPMLGVAAGLYVWNAIALCIDDGLNGFQG